MAMTQQQKQGEMIATSSRELEDLISKAIKKIGGKKENDLCRYLPMTTGGYMHHFTLRKMKTHLPEKLSDMIKTFITNTERPATVPPKQRAARGSRKRKETIILTQSDIDHILQVARSAGEMSLVRKLTPKKDIRAVKRDLITSIRNGTVEQELWNTYAEIVTNNLMI